MRDRLIELLKSPHKAEQLRQKGVAIGKYEDDCVEAMIADFLLSEGVIVLPCKVGDKLYALSASKTKMYILTITHFVVTKNETQIWAVGVPYSSNPDYICNYDDLNDNEWVYLTREEAEKALERSEE